MEWKLTHDRILFCGHCLVLVTLTSISYFMHHPSRRRHMDVTAGERAERAVTSGMLVQWRNKETLLLGAACALPLTAIAGD